MSDEWKPVDDNTPRGRVLWTRIQGADGVSFTDQGPHYRFPGRSRTWAHAVGSYSLRAPTHWREATGDELNSTAANLRKRRDSVIRDCDRAIDRLRLSKEPAP